MVFCFVLEVRKFKMCKYEYIALPVLPQLVQNLNFSFTTSWTFDTNVNF
jgi:hypothetical protein